jgi:hypothetical protein
MRHLMTVTVMLSILALDRQLPVEAQDLFARSRAGYAALKSYSDTGTVVIEYGLAASPMTERHTFHTRFRAPRHYYFEFNEDKRSGGDRFVMWSDDEAFHNWWSTTEVESVFPKGRGAGAFPPIGSGTAGSSALISPLLFPQAGLVGTLTTLGELADAGSEIVGGRQCHKLTGIAKWVYPSGHETGVRRVTIWIDAGSLLIRKVFEDTPKGALPRTIGRSTATLDPIANPPLDDSKFRFIAPSTQK